MQYLKAPDIFYTSPTPPKEISDLMKTLKNSKSSANGIAYIYTHKCFKRNPWNNIHTLSTLIYNWSIHEYVQNS